jgi:hypothetical protein
VGAGGEADEHDGPPLIAGQRTPAMLRRGACRLQTRSPRNGVGFVTNFTRRAAK